MYTRLSLRSSAANLSVLFRRVLSLIYSRLTVLHRAFKSNTSTAESFVCGGDGEGSLSQKLVTRRQRVEAVRMEATSTKEASHAASTDEPRPGLVTTSHTR